MAINQSKKITRILAICLAVLFVTASLILLPASATELSDNCEGAILEDAELSLGAVSDHGSGASSAYQPIANAGNSLAEVAAIMLQFDYEMVAGFDINGKCIFAGTSLLTTKTEMASNLYADFHAAYGTVIVHNHPSDASFSGQDLAAAANWSVPRMVVVSDPYIYTVEPTTDGWSNGDIMKDYYNQRLTAYTNEAKAYISGFRYSRSKILAEPDTPDDGSLAWYCKQSIKNSLRAGNTGSMSIQIGGWVSHRAMQDVAAQYKLAYLRYNANNFDYGDSALFYSEAVARRQMQNANIY